MLCLLFLCAILTFVAAQGQNDFNCSTMYYTVNTYQEQKSFNFSCYETDSSCDVYYTPPGIGCNGNMSELVGNILENETKLLTAIKTFKLGGGFCSSQQIGVYDADTQAYLPRASEAGTGFHLPMLVFGNPVEYECTMSAMSLPANASIAINDDVRFLTADPFEVYKFHLSSFDIRHTVTMINSDNPIVVSCFGATGFITLQPISSEPLLLVHRISEYVSVVISDCSTNELVQDFSKAKLTYDTYAIGSICTPTRHDTDEMQILSFRSPNCVLLVEPLDNLCVSVMSFANSGSDLSVVGLPKAKFSTRFVHDRDVNIGGFFSFSETTCHILTSESEVLSFLLTSLEKGLSGILYFADQASTTTASISLIDCDDPVLPITPSGDTHQFLSAYQSDSKPLVENLCPQLASDARSLFSSIGWVAFFGFFLFSSNLV